jgi:hypothetical protein
MATTFSHSSNGLTLGTSRTLIYGPVTTGTSVVVFSGAFSNVDSTNKAQHTFTLERYDGTNYHSVLTAIPIPYGSASKCPKLVLAAGESLYGTADTTLCVAAALEVMIRS